MIFVSLSPYAVLTVRSVQCQCYNANEMRHLIQYTLSRKSVIKQQNRVDIQQSAKLVTTKNWAATDQIRLQFNKKSVQFGL